MTGKTHAVIGANTLWLIQPMLGQTIQPLLIPLAMLAALLPDLDASESTIKHLHIKIAGVKVEPFYLPAVIFSKLFRHRGWLHSAVAILVVGGLSFALLSRYDILYPLVITFGYTSHILSDALTISGVHFFLPMKTELHLLPKPLRIKTGGLLDTLFFIGGVLGIAGLLRYVTG